MEARWVRLWWRWSHTWLWCLCSSGTQGCILLVWSPSSMAWATSSCPCTVTLLLFWLWLPLPSFLKGILWYLLYIFLFRKKHRPVYIFMHRIHKYYFVLLSIICYFLLVFLILYIYIYIDQDWIDFKIFFLILFYRKIRPKMTLPIFLRIMVLGFLE